MKPKYVLQGFIFIATTSTATDAFSQESCESLANWAITVAHLDLQTAKQSYDACMAKSNAPDPGSVTQLSPPAPKKSPAPGSPPQKVKATSQGGDSEQDVTPALADARNKLLSQLKSKKVDADTDMVNLKAAQAAKNAVDSLLENDSTSPTLQKQSVDTASNLAAAAEKSAQSTQVAASLKSAASKLDEVAQKTNTPTDPNGNDNSSSFFKNWALGLAYIQNRPTVISDASIVDGTIRTNSQQTYQTELILGKHWYFQGNDGKCRPGEYLWGSCFGLFLGVGTGGGSSTQIIDFFGGGAMVGFGQVKDSDGNINEQSKQHSVGIGWGRRFNVKVLGDGFTPNATPPTGETQVRYKTVDLYAPFLFYTYNF